MKANRIHRFGPPEVIVFEDVEKPNAGEVLVAVEASGAGPWERVDSRAHSQERPGSAVYAWL